MNLNNFLIAFSIFLSYYAFFFFNDTPPTEIYTLSLHDALPISLLIAARTCSSFGRTAWGCPAMYRSEEHTSELQSRGHLVCRLLLEKKKKKLEQHSQHAEVSELVRNDTVGELCLVCKYAVRVSV